MRANARIQGQADLQQPIWINQESKFKDWTSKNRAGSLSLGMHCYVILISYLFNRVLAIAFS